MASIYTYQELLDVFKDLEELGLGRQIDLPQFVVVGDQSSGKSSVLERLSGLEFETNDIACTRFVTQLTMRKGPEKTISARIDPSDARSEAERVLFKALTPTAGKNENFNENFKELQAAASKLILHGQPRGFMEDVLKVSVEGPSIPSLTLIDTPGLIHNSVETNGHDDVEVIQSMVRRRMTQKHTIILAVISGGTDISNQVVLKYVQEIDPKGDRTIGVITKPDRIQGPNLKKTFIELATGTGSNFSFALKCFMLRNLGPDDETPMDIDQHDAFEKKYLSAKSWSMIPEKQKGRANFEAHIEATMDNFLRQMIPTVTQSIEGKILQLKAELKQLQPAVNSDPMAISTRINQCLPKLLQEFDDEISRTYNRTTPNLCAKVMLAAGTLSTLFPRFRTLHQFDKAEVQTLMDANPTRPLEAFSTVVAEIIYYKQSTPWEGIGQDYIRDIVNLAETCLVRITTSAVDPDLHKGTLNLVVQPAIQQLKQNLQTLLSSGLPDQTRRPARGLGQSDEQRRCIDAARTEQSRKGIAEAISEHLGISVDDNGVLPLETLYKRVYPRKLAEALDLKTRSDDVMAAGIVAGAKEHYNSTLNDLVRILDGISMVDELKKLKTVIPTLAAAATALPDARGFCEESLEDERTRKELAAQLAKLKQGLERLQRPNPS